MLLNRGNAFLQCQPTLGVLNFVIGDGVANHTGIAQIEAEQDPISGRLPLTLHWVRLRFSLYMQYRSHAPFPRDFLGIE